MSRVNLFLNGVSLYQKALAEMKAMKCSHCNGTGRRRLKIIDDVFTFDLCTDCHGTGMSKDKPTHYKGKELTDGKTKH